MTKSPLGYTLLAPDGSDFVDIPKLWNDGVTNTESLFDKMGKDFDRLSMQPGNRTTDTLTRPDLLDVWTSVITDAGGRELARKVDKEGKQPDGKAMWTTTITIGDKTVTVTDKETATGWVREVK